MLWFTSWLHSSLFLLPICRRSVHFLIQIKQPVDANFFGLFLVSIFPSSWLTQLNKQCSTMKNVGFYVIPNYEIFSFLVAGLLSHNTVLRIINFVKACFQVLSFKNVQSPTRLLFRLIGAGVMTSWLKTVICIGCGNGSTHTVLFTFHPSKINQYKWLIEDHHMLGLWKRSKLCTLAVLSYLSLIKNDISISHWLTTITVFDSHAGLLLQTVMFHLSLMVNKSVLACQGLI